MSENIEPVEHIEAPEEVTDEEIKAFLGGEEPSFHTVLEVWRAVLEPVHAELEKKVTPQWANRITQSYREINFADMEAFRDRFYGHVVDLADLLAYEIATDEKCLTYATPAEDAEHNAVHYKNLLLAWQQAVLHWEQEWECTDPFAAVELAAISEVHKMFFGPTGFTSYLDQIPFEFTEADQAMLAEALNEQKAARE